jgi:hypothetical protein
MSELTAEERELLAAADDKSRTSARPRALRSRLRLLPLLLSPRPRPRVAA